MGKPVKVLQSFGGNYRGPNSGTSEMGEVTGDRYQSFQLYSLQ